MNIVIDERIIEELTPLIRIMILYYMIKAGNIAVIFMENSGEAMMKLYRAFKEES